MFQLHRYEQMCDTARELLKPVAASLPDFA
jgi:hypothetical protein